MKSSFIKITALCVLLCGTVFSGCSKKADVTVSSQSVNESSESTVDSKKVAMKSYSFPKSLNNKNTKAKPVYESFNKLGFVKKSDKKIGGIQTEKSFGNVIYSYKNGNYVGLTDDKGRDIISADRYLTVDAVSRNLLELTEVSGKAYVQLADNGEVYMTGSSSYTDTQVSIVPAAGEGQGFSLMVGDTAVNFKKSQLWDKLAEIPLDSLKFNGDYTRCFKAERGSKYYYICFDRYNNYYIFNGEYAYVKMKIGKKTGDFYVRSYESCTQLASLVDNFGRVSFSQGENGGSESDYIQIRFGLNGTEEKNVTISPDGCCLTEITHKDGEQSKYFNCLDSESFASLVQWVEQSLAG